jgi:hypothetical protein
MPTLNDLLVAELGAQTCKANLIVSAGDNVSLVES